MKIYNVVMHKENPQIFKTVEEVIDYIEDFVFEYVSDNSDLDLDDDFIYDDDDDNDFIYDNGDDEITKETNEILTTLKTKLRKAKNKEIIMTPIIEDVIVIRVFEM